MKKIYYLLVIIILLNTRLLPQELIATVSINTESLPVEHREYLTYFKTAIEDYLNKNRWTEFNWKYNKIPINFQIFFKSVSGVNKYSAQVAITASREIYNSDKISPLFRTLDNNWDFNFDKNQILNFNPEIFEPLTGFLNYYAYVILGLYFDSYQPLGGTKFFTKAANIANLGASSPYNIGWIKGQNVFSRQEYINEFFDEKYQLFRKGFFEYHYNGLDLQSENRLAPFEKLKALLVQIENIRSKVFLKSLILKIFFDTKYLEICDILINQSDKSYFDILKKLDPSHISNYEEAKKK